VDTVSQNVDTGLQNMDTSSKTWTLQNEDSLLSFGILIEAGHGGNNEFEKIFLRRNYFYREAANR
jgi:hypothetical protein